MGEYWQIQAKKLALAYNTGWEYMPEGDEAGSVLTDIFLEMAKENRKRYEKIWEKQELAFLNVVPEWEESGGALSGTLAVKASGEEHGRWLKEGTEAYTVSEQGVTTRFQTTRSLQLSAAKLQYAIYCRGLSAWLTYDSTALPPSGEETLDFLALFGPRGEGLSHPVFRWYFQGLCDGKGDFCFAVDFRKGECPSTVLPGKWTVSDGEIVLPADWHQTGSDVFLEGRMPEFAGNLEGRRYEVKLELTPEEELTKEWLETLCEGFGLREAAMEREPDLCLTDYEAGEGGRVLPFGSSPDEASCCYLACDRILAEEGEEIELRFRESFLTEEKLPEPHSKEYEKLCRKYPWMQMDETVREWRPEDTLWEYFNGNLWRALPGSESWKTGCRVEAAGQKAYRWKRPQDMKPCSVEGEEHFFIRLRLRRVLNAYAMYYRKAIPVLEEIRFRGEEQCKYPVAQEIPDDTGMKTEKIYLGFDREVTSGNCWYTGEGFCSFDREMILGKSVRFGREAFWVELTEKREGNPTCFVSNFVPVRQLSADDALFDDRGAERQPISAGAVFYLEPNDMGVLEAICLSDIRCCGDGAPALSKRRAAEDYFAHFGRLLTPMDMELMLQERYPLLEVGSCVYRREDRILEVALAYGKGAKERAASPYIGRYEEEIEDRLPEIRDLLEKTVSREGPLWLQGCKIHIVIQRQKQLE